MPILCLAIGFDLIKRKELAGATRALGHIAVPDAKARLDPVVNDVVETAEHLVIHQVKGDH